MKRFLWRFAYSLGSNNNMWMFLVWTLTFFDTLFNLFIVGFGPSISFEVPLDKEMQENYNIYFNGLKKAGYLSSLSSISWINIFWLILLGVAGVIIIVSAIMTHSSRRASRRRTAGNIFSRSWKAGLGIFILFILFKIFSFFGNSIGSWFRTWSWNLWFLLVIASLLSLLFLWDEVSRAWQTAYEKMAERRAGKVKGPAPVPAIVQAGAPATPQTAVPAGGGQMSMMKQPLTFRSFLIWEFLIDFLTELSLFRR